MAASTALANAINDYTLRGVAMAAPAAARYIGFNTGDPGATGANEMAGGSYARSADVTAAFNASASGVADNSANITVTAAAGTATHWSCWSAPTGGSFIRGGALSAPQVCLDGQLFTFSAGDLEGTVT
jgi:hypothetical protein